MIKMTGKSPVSLARVTRRGVIATKLTRTQQRSTLQADGEAAKLIILETC